MEHDRSYKKADYDNRKPNWQKDPLIREARAKDPLRDYRKVPDWFDDKQYVDGTIRFLRLEGNKVKVVEYPKGCYNIYYKHI